MVTAAPPPRTPALARAMRPKAVAMPKPSAPVPAKDADHSPQLCKCGHSAATHVKGECQIPGCGCFKFRPNVGAAAAPVPAVAPAPAPEPKPEDAEEEVWVPPPVAQDPETGPRLRTDSLPSRKRPKKRKSVEGNRRPIRVAAEQIKEKGQWVEWKNAPKSARSSMNLWKREATPKLQITGYWSSSCETTFIICHDGTEIVDA